MAKDEKIQPCPEVAVPIGIRDVALAKRIFELAGEVEKCCTAIRLTEEQCL
jgi:hypothetical protein